MVILVFILLILVSCGCSTEERLGDCNLQNSLSMPGKDIKEVVFPDVPIEIFNNQECGMALINYFNIIQIEKNRYYLYYSGFSDVNKDGEYDQNLYLATSEDGFHYSTTLTEQGGGKNNTAGDQGTVSFI